MRANLILKHNIDALLRARGQTHKDLAQWCYRSESWMSKIFRQPDRGVPLKYLDRIADFFGLQTYQLFSPGTSSWTERRSGKDRRTGHDRRALHGKLAMQDAGDEIVIAHPRGRPLSDAERALIKKLRRATPALQQSILTIAGVHVEAPRRQQKKTTKLPTAHADDGYAAAVASPEDHDETSTRAPASQGTVVLPSPEDRHAGQSATALGDRQSSVRPRHRRRRAS